MMITENVIELQNWYLRSLEYAERFSGFPAQRGMYERQAKEAKIEFLETYGVELCTTLN